MLQLEDQALGVERFATRDWVSGMELVRQFLVPLKSAVLQAVRRRCGDGCGDPDSLRLFAALSF
jgi:hypothetical protein